MSVGEKTSALKVGDTVVYSKFGIGVTDLEIKGEEYAVLREEDIIGTFPSSGARPRRGDATATRHGAAELTPVAQARPPPTWAA